MVEEGGREVPFSSGRFSALLYFALLWLAWCFLLVVIILYLDDYYIPIFSFFMCGLSFTCVHSP
jgi:hypothetical protein